MSLCLMCRMGMPTSCQDISCDSQTGEVISPTESSSNGFEQSSRNNSGEDDSGGASVTSITNGLAEDNSLSSEDDGDSDEANSRGRRYAGRNSGTRNGSRGS